MGRVLFSSVPAPSHIEPMLPLARAVGADHEVVFATGPAGIPTVEAAGLRAVPRGLDWWEPRVELTFPELSAMPLEDKARWWFHEIFLDRAGRPMARDLVELLDEEPADLVVRTQLEFGGWAAGRARRIPQVVLGLGGTPRVDDLAGMRDRLAGLLGSVGVSGPVNELSTYGDLFLTLHPETYDPWVPPVPSERFRPPVPFPDATDQPPPEVLADADGRPVVLATFGTVFNRTPGAFEVVIDAMAELPVVAVVTVGTTRDPADLEPTPENVRVRRYVPYDLLLPHCDAVVCHGGFNTTMAALAHQLPLVIVPLSADQPWHAQRCEQLGVALAIPFGEATIERVRDAVSEILFDQSYREATRQLSTELRNLPPLYAALPKLTELAASTPG